MGSKNEQKPFAIMIFGAPCSGKTTFATQFANKFHAMFLNINELTSGHTIPRKFIISVLGELTKSRTTIVLEGGADTEKDRRELRNLFNKLGYTPILFWIQTDQQTLKKRIKSRHDSVDKAKNEFETKLDVLEAPIEAENPFIISGKHTFLTQIKGALGHLSKQQLANKK